MNAPHYPDTHSFRRGAAFKKLLVFLGMTAIMLGFLEWAVARYFPVGGQVYALNEELLFDAVPGAARIQVMPAPIDGAGDAVRVPVRIGADGFRGANLEEPKRRKRVLVIGDSLVMAENVPLESTFVHWLGRELSERLGAAAGNDANAVETVNAGRSGYGPDQALLLLQRELEPVDPDLVVCVLCAHNDFGDLMRNKLFRLGEDGAAERATPIVGQREIDLFAERQRRSSQPALQRLWRFWKDSRGAPPAVESVTPGTVSGYAAALNEQAREHLEDRNPEVVSLFQDFYDIDVAASLPNSFAAAKVELMTGVLFRMVKLASQEDVPILFVIVPSAVDLCEGFGVKVDPLRFPTHSKTALVDALIGAVGLAGGIAIDVTPALVGEGSADRHFVGGVDIHWNASGQRAAASYVAEEIMRDNASSEALGASF